MLFILSLISVDRFTQTTYFNVYRDSKVCGHVPERVWDNRPEPVD